MLGKLKLFFQLFRQGEEVADPKFWKDKQTAANKLAVLLGTVVLLAKAFGLDIPLSTEDLGGLALFIGGVGNWVFTTITSKRVGVSAKPSADPVQVFAPVPAPAAKPVPGSDPASFSTEDIFRGG